ncbi:MAG: hypothetical protein FWC69_05605, partial [Defluviitaleaceae bacterium]|nr:hypothetical protein [Defluviitaleaceae bacterium]
IAFRHCGLVSLKTKLNLRIRNLNMLIAYKETKGISEIADQVRNDGVGANQDFRRVHAQNL